MKDPKAFQQPCWHCFIMWLPYKKSHYYTGIYAKAFVAATIIIIDLNWAAMLMDLNISMLTAYKKRRQIFSN